MHEVPIAKEDGGLTWGSAIEPTMAIASVITIGTVTEMMPVHALKLTLDSHTCTVILNPS